MFEQHPVPQQISSYQFRLVGDMTLKQFFQLAAGALLGLLIYASPLPGIFKWPLIVLFVIAGAAFAFLPLQERPLEEWLSAFFRAIYGPTLFTWSQKKGIQYYATDTTLPAGVQNAAAQPAPVLAKDSPEAKLESHENNFLKNVTNLFSLHPKTPSAPQQTQPTIPANPVSVQQPPVAPQAPVLRPAPVIPQTPSLTHTVAPQARVVTAQQAPSAPQVSQTPQPPKAGSVFVATPQVAPISVQRSTTPIPQATTTQTTQPAAPITTSAPQPVTAGSVSQTQAVAPQFSAEAAPPTPTTIPNVVVGQVMDVTGKIIEGAIVVINDFQNRPVRAFKTNKVGHFMIVTPLPNGSYKMNIEKEGYTFDPISFEAHGALIQPIAIKGTPAAAVAAAQPAAFAQQTQQVTQTPQNQTQ